MDVEVLRKWRALAEQRRAHFLELYLTGRWKHYYAEQEFVAHMREAIQLLETWGAIAPSATEESAATEEQPASEKPASDA